jgi:hypothetical protein
VPAYPEPVVDRMNTGRGIRSRPVPYNVAQLVDAISLDYESGYKGCGDLEITFDDDALKNPSNAPAEGKTTLEDSVSAGAGVRGDVVRGEGAGPRMRDRRCPLTHRHGLRRGLAQRHTVVPGQACPQA